MSRIALAAACLLIAAAALADPARAATLDVQGVLRSSSGGPVADGKYAMFFRLYDAAGAKTRVWDESLDVAVRRGLFRVRLGAGAKTIPDALLSSGKPLWLGLKVGLEPELPRAAIGRVPAAWFAARAAQAAHADLADKAKAADLAAAADTADKAKLATRATTADKADLATRAKLADRALKADEANSAGQAGKAKYADVAADLSCAGCVKPEHLSKGVKAGAFAKVNVQTTKCDATFAARVVVSGKDLYFCAGGQWRKIRTCGGQCTAAKNIACGQPLPDDCGDTGKCPGAGTFCAIGECKAGKCVAPPGGSSATAGIDCAGLLKDGVHKSGVYWIDPDGKGQGRPPLRVYCDMKTDGGGWTVLAHAPTHVIGQSFSLSKDYGQPGDFVLGWHWMATARALSALKFTRFRGRYRYLEDQPGIPQTGQKFDAWVDYIAKGGKRSLAELTNSSFSSKWSVKTISGATCNGWYSLFNQFWNTLATGAQGGSGGHGYCGFYNPGQSSEGWCAQAYKVSECNRGGYGKYLSAWYMVR